MLTRFVYLDMLIQYADKVQFYRLSARTSSEGVIEQFFLLHIAVPDKGSSENMISSPL